MLYTVNRFGFILLSRGIIPDLHNSAFIFITTITHDLSAPVISSLAVWSGPDRMSDEVALYDLPLSHYTDLSNAAGQKTLEQRRFFVLYFFFPPALSTLFVHFTNCHSKHFHFVRYIKIFAVFLYYPYKLNW